VLVHHTRKKTPRLVLLPVTGCAALETSMRSATRTSISGARRNTWCYPASTAPPVCVQLAGSETEVHLEVIAKLQDQRGASLEDPVLDLLPAGVVLTRATLRQALGVKNERLGEALKPAGASMKP
jgi:hypothetical protein